MNATLSMPLKEVAEPLTVQDKFKITRHELSRSLIERQSEIDLALTCLLANEHLLLLGPPGTGKSLLVDSLMKWMHGSKFSCLLNRFTLVEELVGMFSLSELKSDRFMRVTKGKLAEAQFAFLDEVYLGSPAILNVLLKILNERTFDCGDGVHRRVPLELCVAASNHYPHGDDAKSLAALIDRFLVRKNVAPIHTKAGRQKLLWANSRVELSTTLSHSELEAAKLDVQGLEWTKAAVESFELILHDLVKDGVIIGDRRQFKATGVVRAYAWLLGAKEVLPEHLEVLMHVLWTEPLKEPPKVKAAILKHASPESMKAASLLYEANEVMEGCNAADLAQAATAAAKLSEVQKKLSAMKKSESVTDALHFVKDQINQLRQKTLDSI